MRIRQAALLFSLLTTSAWAHTRLECPPSRSKETGEKVGPCDAPDDLSLPAFPLVPNALNTITWLESIPHPGAPARFALSLDGMDEGFEECLLLDHVPHDELSKPSFGDESTFHRSSITLFIPDIYCERCNLQLMTVMSDGIHGVPDDTHCAYRGAQEAGLADPDLSFCPIVYHSCSPVSINGTVPRNQIESCNTPEFEKMLDWPFRTNSDYNQNYSTYYSKGNPGMYNQTDSRLLAGGEPIQGCKDFGFCDPEIYFVETVEVPPTAPYATLAGTCAAIVGMEVEPFVSGKLPDQVVFEVEMEGYDMHDSNASSLCESINCTDMMFFEMTDIGIDVNASRSINSETEEEPTSSTGSANLRRALSGLQALLLVMIGL